MKKIALILALVPALALLAAPAGSLAEGHKGDMQIGVTGRWLMPQMDLENIDQGYAVGAVFHYWLTRTTTVDVGIDYLSANIPITFDGEDDNMLYTVILPEVGIRWRPRLDILVQPFVEVGAGYELWTINPEPGIMETRVGSGMAYYAGLGFDYIIAEDFTLTIDARYRYFPMNEDLERDVTSRPGGGFGATESDLVDAGFVAAGAELTWKFR